MSESTVYPFLRWAGGKRWLATHLAPILRSYLNKSGGVYYEPFLGAGSMYFGLAPQKSVLSDLNRELIDTYIAVRDSWQEIEQVMRRWKVTKENYYKVRDYHPRLPHKKAARFIWLNRTCYGGLYRVNKKNQFNVPYGGGRTPEVLYRDRLLGKCSTALRGGPSGDKAVKLKCADFEITMAEPGNGDVVYCDPTYSCVTRENFDRYGAIIYNWESQKRLAIKARKAAERGAVVIISNAYASDLLDIFPCDHLIKLSKKKAIGKCATTSNKHLEYLFVMDPFQQIPEWRTLYRKFSDASLILNLDTMRTIKN